MRITNVLFACLLLTACGDGADSDGGPGGTDSGGVDSGGVDSGGVDSGGVDSGGTDAGGTDSGPGDDAGGVDAGGGTDAGGVDAGDVDAGPATRRCTPGGADTCGDTTCLCCGAIGPSPLCLCTTACASDGDCSDPRRPICDRDSIGGSAGVCRATTFMCCWGCE